MPRCAAARAMRIAISPRLATRRRSIMYISLSTADWDMQDRDRDRSERHVAAASTAAHRRLLTLGYPSHADRVDRAAPRRCPRPSTGAGLSPPAAARGGWADAVL